MKNFILSMSILVSICFALSERNVSAAGRAEYAKCAIMTFEKEYQQTTAVFVGEVLNAKKLGDKRIFEFRVKKYWKGIAKRKAIVEVNEYARYQAQFQVGGKYLVFARAQEDGKLFDRRCSRSKDLDGYGGELQEDLKKLGKAKTFKD